MKNPNGNNPQVDEVRKKVNDQISRGPLRRAKRLIWNSKRRHRAI